MSWALMRNPEGLNCDVFISHAWKEGIYEFICKVLHSWPRSARNAWCCMLANPQHLDIGALLQAPKNSPFALALQESSCVLVVPNRHSSVYTRLWCAYEAYVASEAGKEILIARASIRQQVLHSLLYLGAAATLGILLGFLARLLLSRLSSVFLILAFGAALCSSIIQSDRARMALNCVGEMACGFSIVNWSTVHPWLPLQDLPGLVPIIEQRFIWLVGISLFCMMEADRINSQATRIAAAELLQGYEDQGSVEYAECSRDADALSIRAEIGDKFGEVDYAIHVLLRAGISTPALRDIARAGVDVESAAHSDVTIPFLFLMPLNVFTLVEMFLDAFFLRSEWFYAIIQGFSFLSRVVLLFLLFRRPVDDRCFILKMITKTVAVLIVLVCPNLVLAELDLRLVPRSVLRAWFSLPIASFIALLGLALLGLRGTAALPGGLCLLQLFLARGCRALRGLSGLATKSKYASTDSSPDTASSGS
ncbi:unnamed protein product [Symbiodinium natans]|uniref:Uncharacterized protein n=1 Tax=Symbiodinium natans TaxID=878477 RepID=A0A812HZL8_9DINO|nr:unnamed protein product [Symbiodinium natans]